MSITLEYILGYYNISDSNSASTCSKKSSARRTGSGVDISTPATLSASIGGTLEPSDKKRR